MEIDVLNRPEQSRYELVVDGQVVGVADYRHLGDGGDTVVLPHTEVSPALQGRGLGARLVGHVLDDLRAQGVQRVVPSCWYVAAFIDQNPEYQDLLGA